MKSSIFAVGDVAFSRYPDMKGPVKPVSILEVNPEAISQSDLAYLVEVDGKEEWLNAWWIFQISVAPRASKEGVGEDHV